VSIRVYSGPHAESHSGRPNWIAHIPTALLVLTIGLQIIWPLASTELRSTLTVLIVWSFFLTTFSHALLNRGWSWTLTWVLISTIFGFAIEYLGTRTGLPFGRYQYATDKLGWSLAGIPIVIALAWAMMSYPALIVGRRLGNRPLAVVAIATWALATWDLFLDPQMVGEGYWIWSNPTPAIPGIPGIPIINFIGWLVASFVLMVLLNRTLPNRRGKASSGRSDVVPSILYLWTWVGGIVANVFFLGRPAVGVIGGIAMGLVAIPYIWRITERAP